MNGDAQLHARVLRAAAGAAEDTPGVAFLRSGLGALVRGTVRRTGGQVAGVRAERGPGPGDWRIRVHLAVRRGHRALDVTREVRTRVAAAAGQALREPGGAAPSVAVTVTVTDIT
ncbi:hypothetical protein [Streptomyces sp. NPDC017529]|uniref:hypothetical protein n=1 Tax=Streptomyces sp. NPDC017529 TaxID=3365000 RepID=UPI0037AA6734